MQTRRNQNLRQISLAALLALSACTGPHSLRGGKAILARQPSGLLEQTIVQGDNPAQPSRQHQETVRFKTYIVPAGARIEEFHTDPTTTNRQSIVLNAPIPINEREEIRTGAELGAAQKDTARELGSKL